MALQRGFDGADPVEPDPVGRLGGLHEERRSHATWRVASGTLACPSCDVPTAPGPVPLAPAARLSCPYCAHQGHVRDFLSLASPQRAARVEVRIIPFPR